ncbi:membrane-bound PQQ-dependent dehydrogenase, glucose/quinate/shikimate family [Thalassorhabdomicrobium marinisediminis]|uniref:Membrane-bound PQQ-dependent dehydrogenase, glucose/quinate/shikimate family n=2 Tax=Thalassorhabdomicrobium marinisediminis TaxID=2170577 RepID=A0A2T7FTS5_9RHOB|nr:membrane-bound PQQ-dependent dehydrogenase, glucose/quinate/shikimate family [Thalassorhabdomicrobium marinisediminis]
MAAVLSVIGLLLAVGGVWLATLGGSWYYLIAGLGLVLAGVLLFGSHIGGFWIYVLVYIGTWIWAVWEVGMDLWPLVPRVVAPTVLLILLLFCLPYLHRAKRFGLQRGIAAALTGLALVGFGAPEVQAQEGDTVPVTEPAEQADPEAPGTPEAEAPQAASEPDATAEGDTPPDATPTAADTAPDTGLARAPQPPFEIGADWPAYGGTYAATRYSPLNQITRENVGQLEEAWRYRTGDMPTDDAAYSPENTPLKVGDSLYLCSAKNILIALDAKTGREEWRFDPGVSNDAIPYGATCRSVVYYEAADLDDDALCKTRVIEATIDVRLIAVDAQTGQLCPDFGREGMVDLNEGLGDTVPGWYAMTSPPTVVRGVLVVGAQVSDNEAEDAPSGVVRGYDVVTGELAWAWDLGNPDRTGAPPEGEVYTRGTPNMWTIAAGDDDLGLVYLPMGNSSVDYYGANRTEAENEYSTSLVALDVTTGKPAWHFQTVHYDVWDYDLGSQPTLLDFPTDEGPVPALVLPSKQGQIYVLDRATGEPLHPVEEREVPIGGVEPENLSPTQPYSGYAALNQPPLTEKDMWGMSPLDQLWCRIQFRRAYYEGEYTPPSVERPWIQYPGYNGGSDWGSIAVDTDRGIIIANYNDMPNFNQLIPREEADARGLRPINEGGSDEGAQGAPQAGAPYAIDVNAGWRLPTGLLCKEPPYGGIRAIDLETGETLWDQPIGTARNNGPFGIPSRLPLRIGTPNNGGPIITAGGLVFIAATTDDLFRAIDIETGEVLWEVVLPAGGQTTPITYEQDGEQYVVISPGGHHFMETQVGDYVIAYKLPGGE